MDSSILIVAAILAAIPIVVLLARIMMEKKREKASAQVKPSHMFAGLKPRSPQEIARASKPRHSRTASSATQHRGDDTFDVILPVIVAGVIVDSIDDNNSGAD